jgi:hypothetical protein
MTYTGVKGQFVICVDNDGYPASLERWKVRRLFRGKSVT